MLSETQATKNDHTVLSVSNIKDTFILVIEKYLARQYDRHETQKIPHRAGRQLDDHFTTYSYSFLEVHVPIQSPRKLLSGYYRPIKVMKLALP